jgi:glycosyltransferase involved in cell wall biosynthesis
MDILFIGPYRSSSGWGKAAQEYLQALLLTEHNIVARPVYMCNAIEQNIANSILEVEKKSFSGRPQVIIQNVLPDLLEWHEGYNIGIFDTEVWNLQDSPWIDKINLMDEVWVDSLAEADNLRQSGVTCKLKAIPVPINIELLQQYKDVAPIDVNYLDGKFVFYFIGEHNDRKNIMAFVKAFHREFSAEENVAILIKTNSNKLRDEINEFRQFSRTRRNYVPEALIVGHIPEEQIYAIHQRGDCLVVTSRGESQCRPIAEALYFDNHVLCTAGIFAERLFNYDLQDNLVNPVASTYTPIYTKEPPLPHIYTGKELWNEIDIVDLQQWMRLIFNRGRIVSDGRNLVKKLSRKSVSERMAECLSSVI